MAVEEQIRIVWVMGLCGAALGAVYDALQALGHIAREGKVFQAVLDLLFGMLCAAAMILAGLYLRADPFRLFVFAGIALGFTLYMKTLGMFVRLLHRKIHSFVKKS